MGPGDCGRLREAEAERVTLILYNLGLCRYWSDNWQEQEGEWDEFEFGSKTSTVGFISNRRRGSFLY